MNNAKGEYPENLNSYEKQNYDGFEIVYNFIMKQKDPLKNISGTQKKIINDKTNPLLQIQKIKINQNNPVRGLSKKILELNKLKLISLTDYEIKLLSKNYEEELKEFEILKESETTEKGDGLEVVVQSQPSENGEGKSKENWDLEEKSAGIPRISFL